VKIIHLITSLKTGGAEAMLAKLVASMDRSRFENVVVSLTVRGDVAAQIEKSGVPVTSLHASGMSGFIPAVYKVRRILRRERPDIVQSWLPHADLVATVASAFRGGRRLIWNVRSSSLDLRAYPRSVRWVLRLLSALSTVPDAVISNSSAGRQYLESLGFRPKRWVLISNGFALDRFRPMPELRAEVREEHAIPADGLVVALVARYDRMKAHDVFLRAAALVRSAVPAAHFLLAGRGVAENETIRTLAEPLGSLVHFAGNVRDVARLYAGVDVAVNCSTYGEAFSNAVGEAMACGVPCVVTDVGDSASLVADSGRIVPPGDADSLAEAIVEVLNMSPAGRAALGSKGRKRIEGEFTIEAITRRYEALYEDVATLK
jgi:glycosyltransferase involved in cell wall biosynthesis